MSTYTEKEEYEAQQYGIAAFTIKKYEIVLKDGVEFSRSKPLARAVLPNDDISMYPEEIQGMCNGYWTGDVVAQYEASIQEVAE